MEQHPINSKKIEELADLLELAKVTEQQAKDLCHMAEEFAQKWEKRLKEKQISNK
jgi:Asp-tRNA(Asn)/Glu-tRNA(Gln) amidotransferase B subunit